MAASSVPSTSSVFPQFQNTSAIAEETNPFISEVMPEYLKAIIKDMASGSLMYVHLSGCEIIDDDIPAIAWALTSPHCKVELLDLVWNKITDAGAEKLALALTSEHCNLSYLFLDKNQISNTGAEKLALALASEHCTLTHLYLSRNQISDAGAEKLASAFSSENFKLHTLKLEENNMTETGIKALQEALKTNQTLQWVIFGAYDSENNQLLTRNMANTKQKEIDLFSLLLDKVIRA